MYILQTATGWQGRLAWSACNAQGDSITASLGMSTLNFSVPWLVSVAVGGYFWPHTHRVWEESDSDQNLPGLR